LSSADLVEPPEQVAHEVVGLAARLEVDRRSGSIAERLDPRERLREAEAVLGRIRIREAPKVKRAQEFMRDRLNYRRIIQKLDVK
jgi:hypothetical protein